MAVTDRCDAWNNLQVMKHSIIYPYCSGYSKKCWQLEWHLPPQLPPISVCTVVKYQVPWPMHTERLWFGHDDTVTSGRRFSSGWKTCLSLFCQIQHHYSFSTKLNTTMATAIITTTTTTTTTTTITNTFTTTTNTNMNNRGRWSSEKHLPSSKLP